jgi:glycosyltransferase involved in cell wall biosynthesis
MSCAEGTAATLSILVRQMRILHVLDRADVIGGVQTYLADLIPALEARGIESSIACGTDGVIGGVRVDVVDGVAADGRSISKESVARLTNVVKDHRPDLAVQHVAMSPGVTRALDDARLPVVVHAHDYFMTCPGGARYLHTSAAFCSEGHGARCFWRAYTERTTNRRPDRLLRAYQRTEAWTDTWPLIRRLLVASAFVADVHTARGIPENLVRVVGYPVQAPAPASPADDGADVLYVGRLIDAKGVHVLLEALATLVGVTALVAGDGPAREALEAKAQELGLGERVRFVGWITPERRASLFGGSRLLSLPSLWDEPFGIVGVEALGAGLPVVASDAGGVSSWLDDGRTGTLVPRGDSAALAGAINALLRNDELRRRYSAAAPSTLIRYTMERHLDLLLPALGVA